MQSVREYEYIKAGGTIHPMYPSVLTVGRLERTRGGRRRKTTSLSRPTMMECWRSLPSRESYTWVRYRADCVAPSASPREDM